MTSKTALLAVFVFGAALGSVTTWSLAPEAAQSRQIGVGEIAGLEDYVRDVVEACVIVGAGSTFAHIACHLEGY